MVKETRKRWSRKVKFGPHALSISGLSPCREVGCLLALAGWYKPPTRLPFWLPSVIMKHCQTTEQGSSLASRRACHSFTQSHHRVSKAQQKTCSLREQRTKAPSILTLSWRILDEPPRWKVVVESREYTGILGPRRRRIQSGARDEAWSLRAFV